MYMILFVLKNTVTPKVRGPEQHSSIAAVPGLVSTRQTCSRKRKAPPHCRRQRGEALKKHLSNSLI